MQGLQGPAAAGMVDLFLGNLATFCLARIAHQQGSAVGQKIANGDDIGTRGL